MLPVPNPIPSFGCRARTPFMNGVPLEEQPKVVLQEEQGVRRGMGSISFKATLGKIEALLFFEKKHYVAFDFPLLLYPSREQRGDKQGEEARLLTL